MRILVTGGAGFIGSHLVGHFQGRAEVRVLDNLRSGFRRNLEGMEVDLTEASILDRDALARCMEGVDHVFHLAAMVSVPESMEKPAECAEINICGTLAVLEEAARAGVKKVVFSSSSAVYGSSPEVPKHEKMVPAPASHYALSKLTGEYFCDLFHSEGKVQTASLRYFNVFGPRQDPRSAYAAAVPAFIERARKNEPLTIFGDGKQTRDFIHVKDVVAANEHAAVREDVTGVYNVARGRETTVEDLAKTILRRVGSSSGMEYASVRPGDVKHSVAAVERISATGFQPGLPLEEGLAETIAYFTGSGSA